MISSDSMRGYNDALILAVLAAGDSYGYQLEKAIRDRTGGAYAIRETTLYSTLTRLVKAGSIEAYAGEISYGRPRTYYRLRAAGQSVLAAKRKEWAQTQAVVSKFLTTEE